MPVLVGLLQLIFDEVISVGYAWYGGMLREGVQGHGAGFRVPIGSTKVVGFHLQW
jgi:hypothetical protein